MKLGTQRKIKEQMKTSLQNEKLLRALGPLARSSDALRNTTSSISNNGLSYCYTRLFWVMIALLIVEALCVSF